MRPFHLHLPQSSSTYPCLCRQGAQITGLGHVFDVTQPLKSSTCCCSCASGHLMLRNFCSCGVFTGFSRNGPWPEPFLTKTQYNQRWCMYPYMTWPYDGPPRLAGILTSGVTLRVDRTVVARYAAADVQTTACRVRKVHLLCVQPRDIHRSTVISSEWACLDCWCFDELNQ